MAKIRLHPGVWTNSAAISLGGGGAVTAASSSQVALQCVGWAGMVAGAGLMMWGVTINGEHWWRRIPGWLSRNFWWRFRLSPIFDASLSVAQNTSGRGRTGSPSQIEEWIPLHQALRYLVYDSLWARKQRQPETEEAFNQIVYSEFRESLARGDVRARGAKGRAFADDGKPTEEIPVAYWVDGFVLPHALIALGDAKQDAVGNPTDKHTYRRVIIHRGNLEAVWPPSNMTGLTPLSMVVEPLRRRIAEGKESKSRELVDLPDITLDDVIERILRLRGIEDDGSADSLAIIREIGRDIGDQMSLRRLSTWGRRRGTLEPLPFEISKKGIGIGRDSTGKIFHMLQYRDEHGKPHNVTDYRFLKSEIEDVWPDA